MPSGKVPGFEDWDKSDEYALHYNADMAPLHISNLDQPVLEPIRKALADRSVTIKHVVLLKLESARADIFPLRKDSFMFERIADSWKDKVIPDDVLHQIANLTPTAEYLTGIPTGFSSEGTVDTGRKSYGGIIAKNAYTTSTYTLKSLTGTLWGAPVSGRFQPRVGTPRLPALLTSRLRHAQPATRYQQRHQRLYEVAVALDVDAIRDRRLRQPRQIDSCPGLPRQKNKGDHRGSGCQVPANG